MAGEPISFISSDHLAGNGDAVDTPAEAVGAVDIEGEQVVAALGEVSPGSFAGEVGLLAGETSEVALEEDAFFVDAVEMGFEALGHRDAFGVGEDWVVVVSEQPVEGVIHIAGPGVFPEVAEHGAGGAEGGDAVVLHPVDDAVEEAEFPAGPEGVVESDAGEVCAQTADEVFDAGGDVVGEELGPDVRGADGAGVAGFK